MVAAATLSGMAPPIKLAVACDSTIPLLRMQDRFDQRSDGRSGHSNSPCDFGREIVCSGAGSAPAGINGGAASRKNQDALRRATGSPHIRRHSRVSVEQASSLPYLKSAFLIG